MATTVKALMSQARRALANEGVGDYTQRYRRAFVGALAALRAVALARGVTPAGEGLEQVVGGLGLKALAGPARTLDRSVLTGDPAVRDPSNVPTRLTWDGGTPAFELRSGVYGAEGSVAAERAAVRIIARCEALVGAPAPPARRPGGRPGGGSDRRRTRPI